MTTLNQLKQTFPLINKLQDYKPYSGKIQIFKTRIFPFLLMILKKLPQD